MNGSDASLTNVHESCVKHYVHLLYDSDVISLSTFVLVSHYLLISVGRKYFHIGGHAVVTHRAVRQLSMNREQSCGCIQCIHNVLLLLITKKGSTEQVIPTIFTLKLHSSSSVPFCVKT